MQISQLARLRYCLVGLGVTIGLIVSLIAEISATSANVQVAATSATDATGACLPSSPAGVPYVVSDATPIAAATPISVIGADKQLLVDDATAQHIEQLVRSYVACESNGNYQMVAQLVTENFLGATFGAGEPLSRADYLAFADQLPIIPQRVVSVDDVRLNGSGVSADVVMVLGNELVHARWEFVLTDAPPEGALLPTGDFTDIRNNVWATGDFTGVARSRWLIDEMIPLAATPPTDTATIQASIKEGSIRLDPRSISQSSVVITGTNTGKETHELLVIRMASGMATDDLLRQPGPDLPTGITFAGQVTIAPGETEQLTLVDLQPGFYAVVCLLPTKDGTPHLALGERNRFEVVDSSR